MDDAERVARAMSSGPDMAEFAEAYLTLGGTLDDIAMAWAEQAVQHDDSDVVYQDVVSNAKVQFRYYVC